MVVVASSVGHLDEIVFNPNTFNFGPAPKPLEIKETSDVEAVVVDVVEVWMIVVSLTKDDEP